MKVPVSENIPVRGPAASDGRPRLGNASHPSDPTLLGTVLYIIGKTAHLLCSAGGIRPLSGLYSLFTGKA